MEPGTAVGALGAQSIGEPGTQVLYYLWPIFLFSLDDLEDFSFCWRCEHERYTWSTAYYGSMYSAFCRREIMVTFLLQIINASKDIATPIITAHLHVNNDFKSAMVVKGRLEKTMLGEVCSYPSIKD